MRTISFSLAFLAVVATWPAPKAYAQDAEQARQDARASQLFVAGMTRAYSGDHAGAISFFERALELRPDEAAVLVALAESYQARGDLSAALLHAEQATAAARTEPSVYRVLASLRLEAGDVEGAVSALRELVALSPADAAARTDLARTQQQTGDLEAALETYQQLLDIAGENTTIRTQMLHIYQRIGDLEAALETTQILIDLQPDHPLLHERLAELNIALDRPDDAAEALETLLELDPAHVAAREQLAQIYRERGDETSVRALLAEAPAPTTPEGSLATAAALYARADHDPDAADRARRLLEEFAREGSPPVPALLMLGDLRFRANEFDGAIDALAAALAAEPGHPVAWDQLAAAHLRSGDPATAADIAEEALFLFPGQYPLLRTAVEALVQDDRNEEAARLAGEAVAILADEYPEAVEERAQMVAVKALVQMRLANTDRSDALHDEAIDLDPDNAMALNNYAYDLAERGERLDHALAMARRAVEIDPENSSFLDTLGWVHHVRGEHREAVEWLARTVELAARRNAPRAIYYEHLGAAQAAAGRGADAVRSLERALELEPNRGHLRQRIEEVRP